MAVLVLLFGGAIVFMVVVAMANARRSGNQSRRTHARDGSYGGDGVWMDGGGGDWGGDSGSDCGSTDSGGGCDGGGGDGGGGGD